jgi:hypothetical protein
MQGQPVKNLETYEGEDRVISSHEMALKLKETKDSFLKVRSMIPEIDGAIENFQDGELIQKRENPPCPDVDREFC